MVPQGGRRASGGRGGSGSDAEHRDRQSPKNVAQARRSLGLAGAADRGDPPQPAMAAGVARATGGSSAVRTPARSHVRAPGRFGHGGSQRRSGKFGRGTGRPRGGAANEPWKERFFSRAVCSPPDSADASTTAGRDRIGALGRRLRQTGDVGWIANEADPGGACDRWRGQPGGLRRSMRPRGGHRETARGLQTSPRKNVLYKGGLQPPPGRSRAQSRSRTDWLPDPLRRGRGSPQRRPIPRNLRESGGLALHPAHFPVKNQIIPRAVLVRASPLAAGAARPAGPDRGLPPRAGASQRHGQESRTQGRPGQGHPPCPVTRPPVIRPITEHRLGRAPQPARSGSACHRGRA